MTFGAKFAIFWSVLCVAILIIAIIGMTSESRKIKRIFKILKRSGPLTVTEIWERIGGSPFYLESTLREVPFFEKKDGKWNVTP